MRLVLMRFSAMGDVCLMLPIIVKLSEEHPELEIHVVSRLKFAPIFENQKNIIFHGLYLEKDFKGLMGLFRLYKYVKSIKADVLLDLHDVLRTKLVRFGLKMGNSQVFVIEKNRKERSELTKGQRTTAIKSAQEIYLEAIQKAGFLKDLTLPLEAKNYFRDADTKIKPEGATAKILVGVAPFAAHETKIWPLERYKTVFEFFLEKRPEFTFLVFGGGKQEKKQIDQLFSSFSNVRNTIGEYKLKEELRLLSNLSCMLAMDSANMHLANLAGIPVISIWGSTHSLAGFALPDKPEYPRLEIPKTDLTCRPCSIYGNVPCRRGDHACMRGVEAERVIDALARFIA